MFSVLQVTLILRPECQTMKHSYSTFFIVIHLRFEETGFRSDRRAFSDMRNSSVNSNGGRCSNHYYQRDINSLPLSALPASFVLSTSLYTVTSTGSIIPEVVITVQFFLQIGSRADLHLWAISF
ncbi:hypothetical protein J6590_095370 [Homalodisca vitripennis]|nr:hypothetical protein J6590_095370 [Homalodisca vitripennis]